MPNLNSECENATNIFLKLIKLCEISSFSCSISGMVVPLMWRCYRCRLWEFSFFFTLLSSLQQKHFLFWLNQ